VAVWGLTRTGARVPAADPAFRLGEETAGDFGRRQVSI